MSGHQHLFIPGPTTIPESIRRSMSLAMEDMRAPDFPDFVKPLLADLKKVFKSGSGRCFVFPSSGTGAWEASIQNVLRPGSKVLMSRFGQFSHLWVDMCERHGFEVEVVDVAWGEGVPVEEFARRLAADRLGRIGAVMVTQNETTTGVWSDVAAVRRALDQAGHEALLLVDGVSSIASVDFRMDEWKVDVCVSGSQKGFMLPTGLGIVCVSQKALAAASNGGGPRCYFDFADQIRTNDQGYFPYTPPTQLLRGLRASLDTLLAEGLDNVFARHHRLAGGVRAAVAAWGLELCAKHPRWHSDTVSAIMVPDGIDSNAIVRRAYDAYRLSLGIGLSKIAGRAFRIGHLGSLNELMVLSAVAGAEMAMHDCGVEVEMGSGVAAAQSHFTRMRREIDLRSARAT